MYLMTYKKHQNGFTLIELMTVIAIIGILSSIIYVSIQRARDKAADKGAQVYLTNAVVQAKLYYFANGESFSGVCLPGTVGNVKSINDNLLNAAKETKVGTTDSINIGVGNGAMTTCHSNANSWAAEVPLRGSTLGAPRMFCTDSEGKQIEKSGTLAGGSTSC